MYKDGMSVSEVTCYFYASATYSCSRPVTHRHVYISATYLYTDSGAAHSYAYTFTHSNTYAYTHSGATYPYGYTHTYG